MLHLLAKSARRDSAASTTSSASSAAVTNNTADESNADTADVTINNVAIEHKSPLLSSSSEHRSDEHHLAPPPPPAASVDASSFDLSTSPLGFVSSLSSTLLASAKHQLAHPHTARKLLEKVKRNVKKGIKKAVIVSGVHTDDSNANAVAKEEADDAVIEESTVDDEQPLSYAAIKRKVRDLAWERMRESAPETTSTDSDSVTSPSARSSPTSLAHTDLSVLRVNFIRLLQRCEALAHTHLHPELGAVPLLHRRDAEGRRSSLLFHRSVRLLQTEYVDEFRGRQQVIQPGKENTDFLKRIAFLAKLSEKEGGIAALFSLPPPLMHEEHTTTAPRSQFAYPTCSRRPYVNPRRSGLISSVSSRSALSAVAPLPPGVFSLRTSSMSALPAEAADSDVDAAFAATEDASPDVLLDRREPVDQSHLLREELFARAQRRDSDASASATGQQTEFSAELQQRALVAELHDMTLSLKENALRMRSALGADSKVLQQADTLLDSNLHSIQTENRRLKAWASAGCSEMCWNILLIVVLWTVFILMFLFMKIFPAPKS